MSIPSNELKKGDKVVMRGTGWDAIIEDNKKGNIRLATVKGLYTEMGSIYVCDIAYRVNPDGTHDTIELTDKQAQNKRLVRAMGF